MIKGILVVVALVIWPAGSGLAQDFPTKPIRLVFEVKGALM